MSRKKSQREFRVLTENAFGIRLHLRGGNGAFKPSGKQYNE
jgi:hypothetical protein